LLYSKTLPLLTGGVELSARRKTRELPGRKSTAAARTGDEEELHAHSPRCRRVISDLTAREIVDDLLLTHRFMRSLSGRPTTRSRRRELAQ